MSKKSERRVDHIGPLRLMAEAEGYVMVRRPGCMPFLMSADKWRALPELAKTDAA